MADRRLGQAEGGGEEWVLPDPAGRSVDAVRPIRDEIEVRVRRLLSELGVTATR